MNRLAKALAALKAWWHILIHGRSDEFPNTRGHRAIRWARIGVLIAASLITLQSLLLVAGAVRNDFAIKHNMGVAEAEVLSAGPRRSTIEFVTPDHDDRLDLREEFEAIRALFAAPTALLEAAPR